MSESDAADLGGRLPRGVRWRDLPDHLVVVDCSGCRAVLLVGSSGQVDEKQRMAPRTREGISLRGVESRVSGFAYCRGCFRSLLRVARGVGRSLGCVERTARTRRENDGV